MAFLAAGNAVDTKADRDAELWVWDGRSGGPERAFGSDNLPDGWMLPEKNALRWSRDGKRLFFGLKPESFRRREDKKEETETTAADLTDVEKILAGAEVDVWHWDDPLINPQQKIEWPRRLDHTYPAVYHADSRKTVRLADLDLPRIRIADRPGWLLGVSDRPYRKQVTWYGRRFDLYLVDINSGRRTLAAEGLEDRYDISPEGRYVVYYRNPHWYLFDRRGGGTRCLTEGSETSFSDEDHDYPNPAPSYGPAGWIEGDRAVLIYDKFDIWSFPLRGGAPVNLTGGAGRRGDLTFRILRTDQEKESFSPGESLLLSSFHNRHKNYGFYTVKTGGGEPRRLLEEEKRFHFLAKAKKADILLYTREAYSEFPDLWTAGSDFSQPRRVSDVNPQIAEFAWGSAELVEWRSDDGTPLQGVLIKPGNYREGEPVPVIVYYYRFFSQRLHEFNQVVINHRPCFPFYASNGYAVFLPDVRFRVGRPGPAAVNCLVPGVQKIIDMGVADPGAVGLHGHSWSGYQTAFVITRTDIFRCAVAGAPVSNMTSAYSGIRWGSGMARQFQYEQSQSRIGASLWERRDLYIENSPVFFADRIRTPLLIIHGDQDGAVPWYQGIELYLAMRRLGKDCVFLQYRGEPHHPGKYPNKLDWFKRMKEYFDHYLKGEPGPAWITEGIAYTGK
jgi:dipeptidyl aminopeptidase/acylaminoacyl peptidase